jgi:hypothetical protein
MAKAIHILSPGHSGSTLLDLIMGSIDGCFSTGELTYLPYQLHLGQDMPQTVSAGEAPTVQAVCTCLKSFRSCPAWSRIISRLSERLGFDIWADPMRLRIALLRPSRYGQSRGREWLAWSRHALGRHLQRAAPDSHLAGLQRRSWGRVIEANWALYEVICEAAASRCVVDSSKDIVRTVMMQAARPGDIRVLLLVRDIRGNVRSQMRKGMDADAAIAHWLKFYRRSVKVLESVAGLEWTAVKYEWLTGQTQAARMYLANFAGVDAPADDVAIDTTDYHLVAGNRMRFRGEIEIRHDLSWQRDLDPAIAARAAEAATALPQPLKERFLEAQGTFAPDA